MFLSNYGGVLADELENMMRRRLTSAIRMLSKSPPVGHY